MADFGKRTAKEDPVVHFYEDFLREYDPKVRELRGVYYTPEPIVSYIVRSVDGLLKTRLAKPLGLADKNVLILDPACGRGYVTLLRHPPHTPDSARERPKRAVEQICLRKSAQAGVRL
jgi:predicted helicase